MDRAESVKKRDELNWEKLGVYLRAELPELQGEMSVAQFHGGHANLTYLVKFDQKELVVRRPPFGTIAPGAHDMKREYKVLSKLYKHFSPAPKAYHLCEDESVIGAKFVVVERKTGVVVRTKILDCFKKFNNPEERISDAMIKAQAELHLIDYKKAKLENLGRPEGFLERQLGGWNKRWNLSKYEENVSVDEIFKWLNKKVPVTQRHSIVHNDIKPDNCQFQTDNPDKVTALFDWDMCTLGDPLLDFGSTLGYWPDKRFNTDKYDDLPVTLQGNFPSKDFLKEKYQEYTKLDLSNILWYEVLAYLKAAIIAQQLYKRYLDGDSKDERMKKFDNSAKAVIELIIKMIS